MSSGNAIGGQVLVIKGNTGTTGATGAGVAVTQSSPASTAQYGTISVTGTTVVGVYEQISGTNLIPTMTNYTVPSGTASASTEFDQVTYNSWHAFDHSSGTVWSADGSALPQWLKYKFTVPVIITSYTIDCTTYTSYAPKTWTFEGSPDNSAWTTLDTQTNITSWTGINTYSFSNSTSYLYYRMNMSASQGSLLIHIQELTMLGVNPYRLLLPVTDYQLDRTSGTGSQILTITRLKTGTNYMVVDYF